MKCSVIRDLLPLYIDEVCSEDTKKLVEEHLLGCGKCRKTLEKMEREMELPRLTEEEQTEAKEPFKQIQKREREKVIIAILITALLFIYIKIVHINDKIEGFFDPILYGRAVILDEGWELLTFDYDAQERFSYSSGESYELKIPNCFLADWENGVTNPAWNNMATVFLRIKDLEGNVILEETPIDWGEGIVIDQLQKGGSYLVEIRAEEPGLYEITFY